MTLNETIAHVEAAHLMVRDDKEWDGLSKGLLDAYNIQDEDLIEQLKPPFLQSWRTVTTYVLRDAFDATEITVADPNHPWGIATLMANGTSSEPILWREAGDGNRSIEGPAGFELLKFSEAMTHYADCLKSLLPEQP
ncbi:hypothetical protein NEK97_02025 [Paenarthrobacter sp. UW852]|uniref:hypothetical protein n=1 Tax=Paenarthrobacter sp. UW852 TaxID=2951989 RepID=UPI0021476733|nr:hypothetical protein [Paenarthrobacter sp. UW852]MCR1160237.1 hypothetical protein [Paenarthrobacter sp. UW852]